MGQNGAEIANLTKIMEMKCHKRQLARTVLAEVKIICTGLNGPKMARKG
jgi:hypothetical protein